MSFDAALEAHRLGDHRPWLPTAATLAHVAADLGDVDAAEDLVAQLEPVQGQLVGWTTLSSLGPADLALGRLYLLLGRLDAAAGALAASAALCEDGGLRPFLAQTRLAQGAVARAQVTTRRPGRSSIRPSTWPRRATSAPSSAGRAPRSTRWPDAGPASNKRPRLPVPTPGTPRQRPASPSGTSSAGVMSP